MKKKAYNEPVILQTFRKAVEDEILTFKARESGSYKEFLNNPAVAMYCMKKFRLKHTPQDYEKCTNLITSVYVSTRWNDNRVIYRIDPTTSLLLTEADCPDVTLADLNLPFRSFCISPAVKNLSGAIIQLEEDMLIMSLQYNDGTSEHTAYSKAEMKKPVDSLINQYGGPHKKERMCVFKTLILLSCEAPDIRESEITRKYYRPGRQIKATTVKQYDVGVRNLVEKGPSLFKYMTVSTGTGSKKCPHVRRGHFHPYRTGPGRKTVVMKWLEPMRINCDGSEPDIVIRHRKASIVHSNAMT